MVAEEMDRSEAEKLYDRLIATHPSIERKGANNPYTSLNGNMFTFLSKEGEVALRLPETDREKLISAHGAWQTISYGAVMKDYVSIPPALLRQTARLRPYLQKSLDFARSLKAKPTTRKKQFTGKSASKKKEKMAPKKTTAGKTGRKAGASTKKR